MKLIDIEDIPSSHKGSKTRRTIIKAISILKDGKAVLLNIKPLTVISALKRIPGSSSVKVVGRGAKSYLVKK